LSACYTFSVMTQSQPHAVVIGSGFGGLAAAIRLGARGFRVTVLEKLDAAGGRAYVFRQDGFTFDAGPTIVTAPFLFEELWSLAGRRMADDVELRALAPSYRIRFDDGESFDCFGDLEQMRAAVARFAPEEIAGFDRFMRASADISAVAFEQLGHVPLSSCQVAELSHLARPGRKIREASENALHPELSPVVPRRQSFHRHVDLRTDRLPGTALGRALRNGRYGKPRKRIDGARQ
jgi:phytoene desaturase